MSASRWRSRRAVERRLAWSGSCCSVVGHARGEGGRHGEATLPKKEKTLWECSPNIVLEVEIGLSETVPQTPRPIYFLRILLERYSEHPIGHPYMLSQRNTEPSKVPFLLSKRVG